MKNQPLAPVNAAYPATKSIAFAAALLGTGLFQSGQAQTQPSAERNLQVQAAATPGPPTGPGQNQSQRVALVIGNSAYKDAPLSNPVNDARAIAKALQESGFSVMTRENIDQRSMLAALREFGDRLRAGGTGLFYYAGHGMQIKGRNYLIPVGAHIDREDEVAYNAVDAQAVLDKMEAAGNVANIMILDACRNNPFTRSMRSGQAGLAQMDAPVGTLLAYATSPGAVASDGVGANGLYTQHLLNAIGQPGNKVEDVFKQVRANVRRDSQGRQVPWESTSLEGDFYFRGGPPTAVDPGAALEVALWEAVKGSNLPIEIRAYLKRYPGGKFAPEALVRLAQLQPAAAASVAPPVTPALPLARPVPQPIPAPAPVMPAAAARPIQVPSQAAVDRRVEELLAGLTTAPGPGQLVKPTTAARPIQAPSQAPVNAPTDADQAAVDRRTEELLAALATGPGPGQLVKPSKVAPARPTLASNKAGFVVGDRWRYQVVDKYKNEVVRNISYQVDQVLANGDMSWNGGGIVTTPEGNFRSDFGVTWSMRDFRPQNDYLPKELRVGHKQDVQFIVKSVRKADNFELTEEHKGSLAVTGKEKIKVPAGEFEAYRIERDVNFTGVQTNGSGRWFGRTLHIFWYVPELRYFAAMEFETRVGRDPATRERVELTSFSVRGAEHLAQR